MTKHFWLICGLWVGIGGALFGYLKAKPLIITGKLSVIEVRGFLNGFALWILIPSILFWGLQLSVGTNEIEFMVWPTPQKEIALTILISVWVALLGWTWFFGGAKTLSKYLPIIGVWPSFMLKEGVIKVMAILVVMAGYFGLVVGRV